MNVSQFPLDDHALEIARFMEDYEPTPDIEEGPPEEWPSWTDAHTWELGPEPTQREPIPNNPPEIEPLTFEPTAADYQWWAARPGPMTDQDVMIATGCCG